MSSNEIVPINLGIGRKLKDKSYRDQFFLGLAKDQVAMMLRQARQGRGLRQVDLAQATGMKQSAISRLEKAEYSAWSFTSLMRIAAALDIRITFGYELAEDMIARYEAAEAPVVARAPRTGTDLTTEVVAAKTSGLGMMDRARQRVEDSLLATPSVPLVPSAATDEESPFHAGLQPLARVLPARHEQQGNVPAIERSSQASDVAKTQLSSGSQGVEWMQGQSGFLNQPWNAGA